MKKHLLLLLCSLLAVWNLHAQTSVGYQDNWPKPNGPVNAIVRSGNTVYIGGFFTSVGGQTRNHLAAIDATTGTLTSWNPNADYIVQALEVIGNTVYAGGQFTTIGGQSRPYIAAIDATTGTLTSWNPNANNSVYALAASGNTLYAGGLFTAIGGQSRTYIAALDATTGNATTWSPNANSIIEDLEIVGSTVYAGGSFNFIGGQNRNRIAALDATTGNATAWNPDADGPVHTLAVSGNTVYVGGDFTNISGQSRNYIAAVDATTGNATAWNPDADDALLNLAVSGNTVYAGGFFTTIGGQSRNKLAALNATTGNATAWDPNANFQINSLIVSGSTVYVGGGFTVLGGNSTRNNFMPLVDSTTLPSSVSIAASATTVCAGTSVTFTATSINLPGPSYQWTKNGTALSGQTAATYTSTTLSNGDVIRCQVTSGGATVISNAVTLTVNPVPAASISTSGPNPFCIGTTLALNASPTGAGFTYSWMLGTTTLSTTTAQHNANAAGSYTVRVTNANGCVGTSAPLALTTKTAPAVFNLTVNSGTIPVCQGSSVTLAANPTANFTGFPNYQWSNNGTAISGATSSTYAASAAGNYTLTVSDAAGCGRTSTARAVTTIAAPVPAISLTGQNPFCAGSSVVLNATPTGTGNSYRWMLGAAALSGTAAQLTATAAGSYTVRVTNANGCVGTSPALVLTTKTPPAPFGLTTSRVAICGGSPVTLSPATGTNFTGFSNYQWSNNGTAIAGANALSYSTTTAGSYTLTVSDGTGCGRTSTASSLATRSNPVASVSTSTLMPMCAGSTAVLNAAPTATGNTYRWVLGSTTIAGATAAAYSATAAGSYTVAVTDAFGCVGTSPAFALTVKNPPAAFNLTAGGLTLFCQGGWVTLSPNPSANLTGFSNYQWSNNGVTIAGATAASYQATTTGNYAITVSDGTGCGRTSVARAVTVNSNPTATITPLGSTTIGTGGSVTLQANAGTGFSYQWLKNGVAISGATAQSYTATSGGSYTVRVTNSNGCSQTSAAVVVTQTSPKESLGITSSGSVLDDYFSFSAFPNPAGDHVTVRTNGAVSQSATVQVMSLAGAAVKEVEMKDAQTEIDLSGVASGVYLLRYKDAEGRTGIVRLVKQ